MGRRFAPKYKEDSQVFLAQNASFQSAAIDIGQIVGYYLEVLLTDLGAAAGSVSLQASASGDAGSWVNVADSSQTIAGSGPYVWNVSNPHYRKVRVSYVLSAGSIDSSQTMVRRIV